MNFRGVLLVGSSDQGLGRLEISCNVRVIPQYGMSRPHMESVISGRWKHRKSGKHMHQNYNSQPRL
jgi:hypothetical protein